MTDLQRAFILIAAYIIVVALVVALLVGKYVSERRRSR